MSRATNRTLSEIAEVLRLAERPLSTAEIANLVEDDPTFSHIKISRPTIYRNLKPQYVTDLAFAGIRLVRLKGSKRDRWVWDKNSAESVTESITNLVESSVPVDYIDQAARADALAETMKDSQALLQRAHVMMGGQATIDPITLQPTTTAPQSPVTQSPIDYTILKAVISQTIEEKLAPVLSAMTGYTESAKLMEQIKEAQEKVAGVKLGPFERAVLKRMAQVKKVGLEKGTFTTERWDEYAERFNTANKPAWDHSIKKLKEILDETIKELREKKATKVEPEDLVGLFGATLFMFISEWYPVELEASDDANPDTN